MTDSIDTGSYRTTPEAVQGIIGILDDVDVTPFIATANTLVTEICAPEGYDGARLELIERWLAAHFYAIYDPRVASESAGISASYESKVDFNLSLTRYGQQALILDTKRGLAVLSKRASEGDVPVQPQIVYLGRRRRRWWDF